MSLVYNERTKLLANALDRASTACVVVGLFTPAVTGNLALGLATLGSIIIWLLAALTLHLTARFILGRLKP